MPRSINTKDPFYNPHRPGDTEKYYHYGLLACSECSNPTGTKAGQRCKNRRTSRNARCAGMLYVQCGEWPYRYSTAFSRRCSFKRGWCTLEIEHAGPCSWKRSGQPCTECAGRGWKEQKVMGVWGPGELHAHNPDWRFSKNGESRMPRELGREKHACQQCGGSGRMP